VRNAEFGRRQSCGLVVPVPVGDPDQAPYSLGLDEFFSPYGQEPRPGFTKATVSAKRVVVEAHDLGVVSSDVRITPVPKSTAGQPSTGCSQWS